MQEFYFNTMEDGRCCAVGYRGDEAEVAIPETYEGAPVAILNDNLFMGHREITSVRIPESVREIGDLAFADCPRAVICAPEESPAILYAQRNGIKHEPAHA